MALGGGIAGIARLIIEADNKRLQSSLKQSEKHVEGFATRGRASLMNFTKAFAQLGLVGGAAGLGMVLKSSIDAASDLNEEITKSQAIFGRSAGEMERWAKTGATAFGLSERAALQGAGAVGNMLRTVGVLGPQLGQMSQHLVELAGDLASFNNEDPSDMLDRLRSGLAGEAEPLRRFGILLSEARVQQEAVRMGLVEQGVKLTEQEKVLARYSLIVRDSATAHGDFARTSSGLANQQRILRGTLENLQATLGKELLPLQIAVTKKLVEWATELQNNKELQKDLKDAVTGTVGAIRTTIGFVQEIVDLMGGWKNASQFIIAGTLAAKVTALAKSFTILAGAEGVAGAAGAASGGKGIAGAAGSAARLSASLNAIVALGTITTLLRIKIVTDDNVPGWVKALVIGQLSPLGAAIFGGKKALDALTGGGGTGGGPVGPPGGPRAPGNVSLSRGADRPGVHTKQIVLDFVSAISGVLGGQPLIIGTGTAHNRNVKNSSKISQHWTGNAADIPASGAALTRLGQAALIAAGANPEWARRQKGGLYNIGGFQIIFNSMIGGNHFNHLHVGVRDGTEIPGSGKGTQVTGPVSTATPTPRGGAPRGGGGVIPQNLELALAEAQVTKGTADDLKALRNIEAWLEKRLQSEKKVSERLKLLGELKSVRSQIATITGGTPGRAGAGLADLIPAGLENKLARAELTKTLNDDLAVLRDIEAYLEKKLAATKKLTDQTRILRQLKDIRSQIEGIIAEAGVDREAIDKMIDKITAPVQALVSGGPDSRPASMFAPGPDFQGQITTAEGKASLGKLLASFEPQKQRIREWANAMKLKKDAEVARIKADKDALAKLMKTPKRLQGQPGWLAAVARLRASIKARQENVKALDAGIEQAFGAWAALEQEETSETQRLAEEDEKSRSQPPESGGGGGDVGGDVGGGGDTRSAADIQAEIDRNVTGYLGAQRDLVRSYSSNVLAAAFAGQMGEGSLLPTGGGIAGSIMVVNNYATAPSEPHAFSKQLEFELKALGA